VSDLLPCHHCGSVDVRRDLNIDIWCDDCGATAPEAVWNRRAKPVIDDDMLDRMCARYERLLAEGKETVDCMRAALAVLYQEKQT